MRKEYKVRITETLSRTVTVKAESSEDAYKIVKQKYDKSVIILDSGDYVETEIDVLIR
ncbi:DpnD/PcfM family protein [Aminipila terrae]|uniref:Protein dpnD n=1 Tax=Aminipila terrae TaxID=2697030 RepID=A0A6P1MIQ5_9FIRM|nr:DpnD/PcfM family protein [Aminipila terrae]QHI73073.1 protein dpnD [Aminipila terrae]